MPEQTFSFSPSLLHRHLARRARPSLAFTGGDVKPWQRSLRAKLRELAGFDEMPKKRCPLRVRSLWKRRRGGGMIEKIVFTSEPHADVNAYVCLPDNAEPPYDWFVCLQGHTSGMHQSIAVQREDETKGILPEGDRDFGLGCIRRGVAALCIEQRAFGERRELAQTFRSDRLCQEAAMHALLLGRTLIGERVYDVDRALDYLETRTDVKRETLGVMGNSGGGTVSMFAAALLPRLRYAMPSCYFCTFVDSIMALHHCECNYVPGLLKFAEMADILGLFAPRPVVVVAGENDGIFPIKAVRKEFKRLKKIYKAAGAPENCRLVVGESGHRFYAEEAWPVMFDLLGKS